MITVLIAAAVLAGWLAARQFGEFGKHAGSGAGALTVQQLLDQADAEDDPGGRHRLREPVVIRGDLADDLETRLLPRAETGLLFGHPDLMARHPWTLRRVHAELQQS
ncbi:hypothetical protein SAMN05421805_102180 [Saccharopolyspora antimicrobica]|uniref:Uncharacterized protein n=1 Tax=Saccharopolyspora antimicrobica TaxID=455193 RepID=A0A1I4VFX0_9PSEU|nr:hypothetical protein [Saccharopolyspora antimicrobica]RKT86284.1 hypothetical protein ATL45_4646 [Saccharopolyspora antimicrobica]SFN00051.1 hypothetical protein SAMN05421805_102180 [Saccharopolyspora antimicrobica]